MPRLLRDVSLLTASFFMTLLLAAGGRAEPPAAPSADIILQGGSVVTVDQQFSIHQAIALKGERILAVGSNEQMMAHRGPETKLIQLDGRMVLPGLIDSHVHPYGACVTEFDHPIPTMETIADVLSYVRDRTQAVPEGEWIVIRQVFITRLAEQRFPTRSELDEAAPKHPVLFSTGPDAAVNSLALRLSGIDENFKVDDGGPGYIEKDPETGEPTGILRACTRYVRAKQATREPSEEQRAQRLRDLFRDYNSVGITGICDRDASPAAIALYRRLLQDDQLSVRIAISHGVGSQGDLAQIQQRIREIAENPLRTGTSMLRIVGIKMYLDGGMLTGSAYMRDPWGLSQIYSITDPEYRGLLFIPRERLEPLVKTTLEHGLQFTAHSVGDGAVHALLDVYESLARDHDLRATRPCITHSNFMSREAVQRCASLGVCVDIQPAWLYLDTRTLVAQFGYERLRYFQPLASLFSAGVVAGGGSDHMQKIGAFRSINPYHPLLGMQTAVTRQARGYDRPLHPEEALTRQQALQFYTRNNAHLMFLDDEVGTLEPGKLADLIVLDRNLLSCPVEQWTEVRCERTFVGGKQVYSAAP